MDGNAQDYSGNNNHGTTHNVVPDTNRFGTQNRSYLFNGLDSYIEIPASPSMNMIQTANEITITAWININQWYDNWNVFSVLERYNPTTDAGWLLEANWATGGILFLADESNMLNSVGCNFTWNLDQWYHLGFTYSQEEGLANFYVDGVNVCSAPYDADINIADTTSSFIVGRSLAGPDEYSDGHIDDLKIYYRVLNSEEVDEIFTVGRSEITKPNGLSAYPNPVMDKLIIRTSSNARSNYTISDVSGRVFMSGRLDKEVSAIDTETLPSGIYFLQTNDIGQGVVKLLKQ